MEAQKNINEQKIQHITVHLQDTIVRSQQNNHQVQQIINIFYRNWPVVLVMWHKKKVNVWRPVFSCYQRFLSIKWIMWYPLCPLSVGHWITHCNLSVDMGKVLRPEHLSIVQYWKTFIIYIWLFHLELLLIRTHLVMFLKNILSILTLSFNKNRGCFFPHTSFAFWRIHSILENCFVWQCQFEQISDNLSI